jgi:hypothetical protein
MLRTPAQRALTGLIAAVTLFSAVGCLDDQGSTGKDSGITEPDTRNDDTSTGQLSGVRLDNLEMPDPATEGPLCVTLSADTSMTLDSVTVQTDANDDPVHTFSDVSVSPSGTKNCTTACFCFGPEPPDIQVELQLGNDRHTIDSGQSAPSGCCESM